MSYRNRKSHEIWGNLEAFLGVLRLIYGRGVQHLPPSQIGLKESEIDRNQNYFLVDNLSYFIRFHVPSFFYDY